MLSFPGGCKLGYIYSHSERLSLSSSTIHSCVLHSATSDFIFCEKIPHLHSEHSYQMVARQQKVVISGSLALAAPRVILTHVPPLQLLSFKDGICLYPCNVAYPDGLLLFWSCNGSSQSDVVKPFIWNCGSMLTPYTVSGYEAVSFRILARRLAGTLKRVRLGTSVVFLPFAWFAWMCLSRHWDGRIYWLFVI